MHLDRLPANRRATVDTHPRRAQDRVLSATRRLTCLPSTSSSQLLVLWGRALRSHDETRPQMHLAQTSATHRSQCVSRDRRRTGVPSCHVFASSAMLQTDNARSHASPALVGNPLPPPQPCGTAPRPPMCAATCPECIRTQCEPAQSNAASKAGELTAAMRRATCVHWAKFPSSSVG